jgi:integrase
VPLFADVVDALDRWRQVRDRIPELAGDDLLFPRLGRQLRDGRFPDAGGAMTRQALLEIVRPIMLAAGVPAEQAHPHTLRHTFGRQYMAATGAKLSRLQRIMGHATPETTSRYVHHSVDELGAEHRRIDRLRSDPLAQRQQRRQRA